MSLQTILTELIQERERISQAIAALESLDGIGTRPSSSARQGRTVSAVARRRMAQAQRARRAREQKPTAPRLTPVKRTMSAASRRKIAAAQRARWARVKKAA